MSSRGGKRENVSRSVINDKMRVLSDFGICDRQDQNMISKLEQYIKDHPEKTPREALDHYCRPMIQAKVNSWK